MILDHITALVLTYNEQENLKRCLESLSWATRVIVVDSCSSDSTEVIAGSFPNVCFVKRAFDNHTNQWNFGLEQVSTEWTLTLDADYVCPRELATELELLTTCHDGYNIGFHYCIFGRRLSASLYPARTAFFRTDKFRYVQDGHTQLLRTDRQSIGKLQTKINHDDRKPLSRWISSQNKYAELEADKLLFSSRGELGWKDRLRCRIVVAPLLTPLYCLFAKRLILDGWAGIFYTIQRTFAELVLSLTLLDRKLRK